MKAEELIARMQEANPKVLQGVPERKAVALVRGVLKQLGGILSETEEGIVKFAGLGQFRVKKVVKSVEGEEKSQVRITFRRAEPGKRKGKGTPDKELGAV